MNLEEALKKADEAVENGYLMPYPQACIVLAAEVRRLKARRSKKLHGFNVNPDPTYPKPTPPPNPPKAPK